MTEIDADGRIVKTIDDYLADWEGHAFGYGYGTGEEHIIPALKKFFACAGEKATDLGQRWFPEELGQLYRVPLPNSFDFHILGERLTPTVAWLLINVLCRCNVLEYGSSPRYSWLTEEGERLKAYVDSKTADELIENITHRDENYIACYPDVCNCGPVYLKGPFCQNPFWPRRQPLPQIKKKGRIK